VKNSKSHEETLAVAAQSLAPGVVLSLQDLRSGEKKEEPKGQTPVLLVSLPPEEKQQKIITVKTATLLQGNLFPLCLT
jgi:hypothetical protein